MSRGHIPDRSQGTTLATTLESRLATGITAVTQPHDPPTFVARNEAEGDNVMLILMTAIVFGAGPLAIHKARQHDAKLEPVEPVDYDALADEAQTRFDDDADAWRKGE
ncbi:hypothetical protein ANMWB30_23790 [Arthrobacter sp. MWB30]|nr:hypothetical protein ANMWB30_23790 [Arthrobacter sp. MWB30]